MLLSIAVVSTDASERYGKQLLSHLGHKVRMEPLPDRPAPAGRLVFAYGVGTVLPMPGQLIFSGGVTAPVPVVAGGSVTFEFDGLGAIEVYGA